MKLRCKIDKQSLIQRIKCALGFHSWHEYFVDVTTWYRDCLHCPVKQEKDTGSIDSPLWEVWRERSEEA